MANLVSSSNFKIIKSGSINPSSLIPFNDNTQQEEKQKESDNILIIKETVIKIDKLLKNSYKLERKNLKLQKLEEENEKRIKKENLLERKKEEEKKSAISKPTIPGQNFITRFIENTLLGFILYRLIPHLPKIIDFLKILEPAANFIVDFAGKMLNGLVTFIDWGYKAYEWASGTIKTIGGEDAEKKFNEFSKQFSIFANLAIIAGMSTMGGTDFRSKKFQKPSIKSPGFDRVRGGRVNTTTQSRYLQRYGKDAFVRRFGKQSLRTITQGSTRSAFKILKPLFNKIPIIGGLIEFGISWALGDPIGKAAFRGVGAALLGALGTAIGGPFGLFLGSWAGSEAGGALYDVIFKDKKDDQGVAKQQEGGSIERVSKKTIGSVGRTLKVEKKRRIFTPVKVSPQKSEPGKDISGGRDKIETLFPYEKNPAIRSPLRSLLDTSETLKEIPFIGNLMGASIDVAMGQKPDENIFKSFAKNLLSLFNYIATGKITPNVSGISSVLSSMFRGGMIPERITKEINERFLPSLENYFNSSIMKGVNKAITGIENQLKLTPPTPEQVVSVPGEISGGSYGGYSPTGFQKEVYEYLINVKKMNDNQALGLMANISRESSFRPGILSGDDGGAGGLFQWKKPRSDAMSSAVPDWKTNWKGQIDYALIEPGEPGPTYLATEFSSPQEAADWWMREWERPRDKVAASKKHREYLKTVPRAPDGSVKFRPGVSPQLEYVPPGDFAIRVESRMGMRDGKMHQGSDISAPEGSPLRAISDGEIVDSDYEEGWGNFLIMKDNKGIYHLYGHMKDGYKRKGKVKKGDIIGKVGMTGRTSGPHLHWESGTGWDGYNISGRFDPLDKYSQNAPFFTSRDQRQERRRVSQSSFAQPDIKPLSPEQAIDLRNRLKSFIQKNSEGSGKSFILPKLNLIYLRGKDWIGRPQDKLLDLKTNKLIFGGTSDQVLQELGNKFIERGLINRGSKQSQPQYAPGNKPELETTLQPERKQGGGAIRSKKPNLSISQISDYPSYDEGEIITMIQPIIIEKTIKVPSGGSSGSNNGSSRKSVNIGEYSNLFAGAG